MKTKQLLLALIAILFAAPIFAQSAIGIPVQGIARDNNGTARINEQIILNLELYYVEGGNETLLYTPAQQETLTTDNFGVFSTIVNTAGRRPVFASKTIFLRIKEGGNTISDEQLNSVPYAIAADNGVPTGAVMPFVGATAPEGWLICDGAAIPNGQQYDALKTLYGNNTPDMTGMFLRGAGTNPYNGFDSMLNTIHVDTFQGHNHGYSGSTNSNGSHTHPIKISWVGLDRVGNGGSAVNARAVENHRDYNGNIPAESAGSHAHSYSGTTASTGSTETRPMHYVVNYIIKL
ncbi:MAG: tail fiber protein [Patiriisocius sp.]|uniref:tail fiber protein n=1 Tax=Patiriisocius sp. TaxID=2822396 RepID=UPI003EFB1620